MKLSSIVFSLLLLFSISASYADDFPINEPKHLTEKHAVLLNMALQPYQAALNHPWMRIPRTKKMLVLGMNDPAVSLLRERLMATHDLPATLRSNEPNLFDHQLAEGVRTFQYRHGLNPDGVVGSLTLSALNVSPQERVREILQSIHRFQTLSTNISGRYALVNIPEYKLYLIDNDQEVLSMKVIVGRPSRPTPELNSVITQLVLNPSWNVPNTIARKDIIPKIIANPFYLDEENMSVVNRQIDNAPAIDPSSIDWQSANRYGFKYHFRQAPGVKNALGLVKFHFANLHDVYLHDTPAKNLFDNHMRALSSGCVRLEKPFDLVSYLIANDSRMDENKLQDILDSQRTTYLTLRRPLPVHITYITAWVDDRGLLNFRDNIYNLPS